MAENSWTYEQNEQFKRAVQRLSTFSPNRFERIAQFLGKSVVNVMEHYQEMVDDLLEIESSEIVLSNGMFDAAVPSWCRIEKPLWDKEEHEWFLIGLSRFGRDCDKIAGLLVTKTPMQVATYARNFFTWHNSTNNVIRRPRTFAITMVDSSVDSTGEQESLVTSQTQPQQGSVALETGQDANISDSESNNLT